MSAGRRVGTRALVLTGLLVALLLAGVVSYYASSRPDGLNRVAEDQGFSRTARDHAADGSPFAGYDTRGVADGRLSGGLAGVVGCVVVLALAGGLTLLVRRRPGQAGDRSEDGSGQAEPVDEGSR